MNSISLNNKQRFNMNGAAQMATTLILVIVAGVVLSVSDIARIKMDDSRKATTHDYSPDKEMVSDDPSETNTSISSTSLYSENADPLWESVNKNVEKVLDESRQAIFADLKKNVEDLYHTPINIAKTDDRSHTTGSDIAVALAESRQDIIEDLNRNVKQLFNTALQIQKPVVVVKDSDDLQLNSDTVTANALAKSRDMVFDELRHNVEMLYRNPIRVTASSNSSYDLPLQTAQANEEDMDIAVAGTLPSMSH